MKRILLSVMTVALVAGAAFAASGAFFSDTETSVDNVFAAGAIDLLVDNESFVTDPSTGLLVPSPNTSWTLDDLTGHLFFNFSDVKPGDLGEDTISLHVNDNDAWLCAAAQVTDDNDVDYTEPELEDDLTVDQLNPTTTDGELAESINFAFWADDGDNVLEDDEVNSIFVSGPISGLDPDGTVALADSSTNVWGTPGPVFGGQDYFIGKVWCFGTLTPNPLPADTDGDPTVNPGVICDGSLADNSAQTDEVVGDIQFYAVQSRNNPDFSCSVDYTPVWPTPGP